MKARVRTLLAVAGTLALVLAVLPSDSLASAGGLDPGFGVGGKVTTPFADDSAAWSVVEQSDHMLVAAGAAGSDFAVARYTTSGTLDPGFGTGGIATTSVSPGYDEGVAAALQSDGKIVVAGDTKLNKFALVRYETDGTPDPTFGVNGIVTTNFTPGMDVAHAVVVQPNGRIVVGGWAGSGRPAFALARYMSDGTLDPSFGGDGMVTTNYGVFGQIWSLALQPDGKIVAAGFNGGLGFGLARYRPNGTLDPTFGDGGKSGDTVVLGWARTVLVLPDGKILAAGDKDIFDYAIARYLPDGRPDPTFGIHGAVITRVGAGEQSIVGLSPQPNGRIVAAGSIGPHEFGSPVDPRFILVRYRGNGERDLAFGTNGKIVTRFDEGAAAEGALSQSDGMFVVVGTSLVGGMNDFALARYLM